MSDYTVMATLSADVKQFISAFKEANSAIADLENSTQSKGQKIAKSAIAVGKGLTAAITVPLAGIAAGSIKMASDFESSMSNVEAISGATGAEMDMLKNRAKELGATTKFTAVQSAEALSYMAMAGWEATEMYEGLPGVMNLAAASGEDLAMTSDIVTDALTAFNMEASESGRFADVLAQASASSNTNVGLMGETFKYVAPIAGTLGYTVEDTAVAIGLMANAGIKGSQAGTALRMAFTRLASPTKEVHTGLQLLGLTIEDVQGLSLEETLQVFRKGFEDLDGTQQAQAASMIFGKQAMSGMLAIMNASEADYKNLQEAINGSSGAAERMAKIMQDNLSGSITIMKSAIEGAGISIGEIFLPKIRNAVDGITDLVTKFNELDPATKEMIVKIGLVAAAIGPLLMILGQLGFAIGNISVLFTALTGPVGLAVIGITAIGAALGILAIEMSKSSLEVDIFGESVSEGTKQAITGFLELESKATAALNQLNWSGQEVTAEMVTGIMENISGMTLQMLEELSLQKEEVLASMRTMYEEMGVLEDEETQLKLERIAESYEQQMASIQEGEERIQEILNLASAEKRALTQSEKDEINQIRQEMKDDGVRILSESEEEYAVIQQRMKDFAGEMSAEQAAEVVKNSIKQRDETIQAAEEEYNERIKLAARLKEEGSEESIALADEIIAQAQKQRDESISAAEEMHNGVITEAKNLADEHVNKVDWQTGEVKSKWDMMVEQLKTNTRNLVEDIKKSWADFKTNTKQSWEEAKQEITTNVENIKTTVSEGWSNLVTTVTTKGSEIVSSVRTAWSDAVSAAREFVSSAISVGRDIIGGFISGVTQRAGELVSAAATAVGNAISAARRMLGIKSPSRVFMGIGDDTMEGFIIGIENQEKNTVRAMGNVIGNVIDEANTDMKFGSLSGVMASTVSHTISDNLTSKQPATLTLRLGNNSFKAFVDDITQTQGQEYELVETYGI